MADVSCLPLVLALGLLNQAENSGGDGSAEEDDDYDADEGDDDCQSPSAPDRDTLPVTAADTLLPPLTGQTETSTLTTGRTRMVATTEGTMVSRGPRHTSPGCCEHAAVRQRNSLHAITDVFLSVSCLGGGEATFD